jgi:hypothetical protein
LRKYELSLLARHLDQLNLPLPPSADGVEPDSVDRPDLPYGEILQALPCSSFLDDAMLRDAVAEYQVHKYLCEETYRDPEDGSWSVATRDSREFPSVHAAAMYSVDDDIPSKEFVKDLKELKCTTPVDEYDKLDPEEINEHELKRALYRIKALLLLKGK